MAMFGNNKETPHTAEMTGSNTIIAKGVVLKGDLETLGTIRLEGKIYGNLRSKGKAILGDTAYVEGNILAQSAEVAGEVKGTLEISEILTLKSSAVINGDINCNKLIVEQGATFNGKCQMGSVAKEINLQEPASSSKASTKSHATETTQANS
jgi:cytoskeletal protein CcmA (bactofilin family)